MNVERNSLDCRNFALGLAKYAFIGGIDLHQTADFEQRHDGKTIQGPTPWLCPNFACKLLDLMRSMYLKGGDEKTGSRKNWGPVPSPKRARILVTSARDVGIDRTGTFDFIGEFCAFGRRRSRGGRRRSHSLACGRDGWSFRAEHYDWAAGGGLFAER